MVGTSANQLRTTSYTYDALSRLKTVVDTAYTGTTTYRFDLVGNVREEDMPNGVIVVSTFGSTNHLTSMTDYAPGGSKLAEYDYTLRADGTDAALNETFWATGGALTNAWTWTYDSLDRLVGETLVSSDTARSYSASYTFDLVGNRLQYTETGATTQTVTSIYDANDRLLQEVSTLGSTTVYGYDHTQETSQVVTQSDASSVSTSFAFDLQGNMRTATIDSRSSSGSLLSREMLTYGYGADGIRVLALDQTDSTGSGTWDQQVLTQYLNDPQNFTGYSQILRETHSDPTTGAVTKVIDYTFGLAGIAQAVTTYSNGQPAGTQTNVFGYDGHGSVRVLTDLSAAIAQLYLYDAYGVMLAIYDRARHLVSSNTADALTTLLYSGETTDSQTGLQCVRARYYNPGTGQFNQLDPYFGNPQNPQTFNKYLFVHGDPVNFIDPTGMDESIGSLTADMGGRMQVGDMSLVGIDAPMRFGYTVAVVGSSSLTAQIISAGLLTAIGVTTVAALITILPPVGPIGGGPPGEDQNGGQTDIALGLDEHLEGFRTYVQGLVDNRTTVEAFPFRSLTERDDSLAQATLRAMTTCHWIHFNMQDVVREGPNGFDQYARLVQGNRTNPIDGPTSGRRLFTNVTNWELYLDLSVPAFRAKTTFYNGIGGPTDAPDWLS